MSSAETTHACPHCERSFATANDAYQHIRANHRKKLARAPKPIVVREPSMGDLVAEAMLDRACGLPVEPWIAEMLDV